MKTVCLDARMYGIRHTGIGRYVQQLIKSYPARPDLNLVLIVDRTNTDPYLKKFTCFPARYHPYSFLSQLEMGLLLWKIRPDLLHVPHFTYPVLWPGRTIITIHDLIKHHSRGLSTTTKPKLAYYPKFWAYLLLVRFAIHRSAHIITPTNYWRDYLINRYRLPPDKITVTYEGVDTARFVRHRPSRPAGDYLIYVGNLYPHKNVNTLVSAAVDLGIPLKIVCPRSVFVSRVRAHPLVQIYHDVSDDDLNHMYAGALAFVFPSLIEGFGLPGLEAMAVGTPVISSNSSCLPEVYGPAALYFSPQNIAQLKSRILELKSDQKLRRQLIQAGFAQVQKYSWSKMGKQTWAIYRKILP